MRRLLFVSAIALAATSAAAIEPGEWTSTSRMTDIGLPADVPAQVADMIRNQMNSNAMTSSSCITRDDLDNAPERMFRDSQGQCEYSQFEMSGGRLNAVAQCTTDQGVMDMVMSGTYTDSTYAMTMNMDMDSPMGAMTFTSQVSGERTGPCSE